MPEADKNRVHLYKALWKSLYGSNVSVSGLFRAWIRRQIRVLRANGARLPDEPERLETFTGIEDTSPRVDD
jgi:hypothetical protein